MNAYEKRREGIDQSAMNTQTRDLENARRYCRNLARGHYENFIVGSILVPHRYVQHLHNIYAFCRYSDDLADETADPKMALAYLKDWKEQLKLCYNGKPEHPILLALQSTIEEFEIPSDPFESLISAFEQDCVVSRYDTYTQLLDYCKCSANPVGRLFLWMFGYKDPYRQELSDLICTGLQLANFWQDVTSDYERGRIYIPREDLERFGCSESDIMAKRLTQDFADLIAFEISRTESLFESAAELSSTVDRRLAVDVELFRRAGLVVLESIRKINYSVLTNHPRVSKVQKAQLLLRSLFSHGRPGMLPDYDQKERTKWI